MWLQGLADSVRSLALATRVGVATGRTPAAAARARATDKAEVPATSAAAAGKTGVLATRVVVTSKPGVAARAEFGVLRVYLDP